MKQGDRVLGANAGMIAPLLFHIDQFAGLAGHFQQGFLEGFRTADDLDHRPVEIRIRIKIALLNL